MLVQLHGDFSEGRQGCWYRVGGVGRGDDRNGRGGGGGQRWLWRLGGCH